jgi:hypothetical protein
VAHQAPGATVHQVVGVAIGARASSTWRTLPLFVRGLLSQLRVGAPERGSGIRLVPVPVARPHGATGYVPGTYGPCSAVGQVARSRPGIEWRQGSCGG